MNKFATGLILGGIAGMIGVDYIMKNNSTKNKIMRKGKQMVDKADDVLDNVSSDIW